MTEQSTKSPRPRGRRSHLHAAARVCAFTLFLLPAYAVLAYVVLPATWSRYRRTIPERADLKITYTRERIPGDPLNVALVGTRAEVVAALNAAGWSEADPITLRSGLRDAGSVLFDRSYPSAPVSTHFLWNRQQDLAFERAVGKSPRRRHHVRFWRASLSESPGKDFWLGAATYDRCMGVSYFTGELMHRIDPDVDSERGTLFADLARSGHLSRVDVVPQFRPRGDGRNGGGDRYTTDGRLYVGVLEAPPTPTLARR